MNTTTTTNELKERRSEGMRRMAKKYGVQITKLFLGVMEAVDNYWIAGDITDDPVDAKFFETEAKKRVDDMFNMLKEEGLNDLYNQFLDSEEYDMVEVPLEMVTPWEYA